MHLLLVTLGPVQEFIAQARRTRDLWFGSHLLSELSREVARALAESGAVLIFPALQLGNAELDPCPQPLRANGKQALSVANKILAEVPEGIDPQQLARKARSSSMAHWKRIAADVRLKCAGLIADDTSDVWDEQVETFLEFAAAWAPLEEYASTRARVEETIARRKHLRDFAPWRESRGGVEKSSLDGARETVLRRSNGRDAGLVKRYRIADGEELDAAGLIKRAGGEPAQFVPIVNVALASWLAAAKIEAPSKLEALRSACRQQGLARVQRPDLPCAERFPFDASVLLVNRLKSVFEEQALGADYAAWAKMHVAPLLEQFGEPYPYVACLVADGDKVGRAIDRLKTADAHRRFSAALAGFAGETRRLVEQDHSGVLVYSGGDDVLAFLPVPEALQCADKLRRLYAKSFAEVTEISAEDNPTLSIGIGVGHVMASMGELLSLGREAERYAKQSFAEDIGGNALAIVLEKRAGGRRRWRSRWDDWNSDPVALLHADAATLEGPLSTGKVYELAALLQRLPKPSDTENSVWHDVLRLEVRRSFARVHSGAGVDASLVGLALEEHTDYQRLHAALSSLVDRVLIARTFAMAAPRQRGLLGGISL
jgi:CRISPR-associated protein Cmr2